jgi:hypothetical protein
MFFDFITIGDALIILLVAMLIGFLSLGLLLRAVLKAVAKPEAAAETIEAVSPSPKDEEEADLPIVLAAAINAYESK